MAGVKFGKISLNYLDLWHFSPSEFSPSLIHGLCSIFASNSWFMRLFQARDTCHGSSLFASLSVHGLHFTVYAASSSALRARNDNSFTLKTLALVACLARSKWAIRPLINPFG